MDNELAQIYGRWQLMLSYGSRLRNERLAAWEIPNTGGLRVESEWALGRAEGYRTWRGSAEAYVALDAFYGLGANIRYAWGWDYYNLGFHGRLPGSGLSFGIIVDHTRPVTVSRQAGLVELERR